MSSVILLKKFAVATSQRRGAHSCCLSEVGIVSVSQATKQWIRSWSTRSPLVKNDHEADQRRDDERAAKRMEDHDAIPSAGMTRLYRLDMIYVCDLYVETYRTSA
jgi:hypothetical protein